MENTVHTVEDQQRAYLKAREAFIAERALYEKQFMEWYNGFMKCTKLHEHIPFEFRGWTVQEKCPELYVEYPNMDVATKQMDEFEAPIHQIDEIAHQINLKGYEEYQKYLELNKQQ